MKIITVDAKSPAAQLGLKPGDDLIELNGHAINDELDFIFYSEDEPLIFTCLRGDKPFSKTLRRRWSGPFGAVFSEMTFRHCGNRCLFCFVDQNPPGLRSTLYFKDEDFRLSFIYGNYVTLTNASQRDLQRIVRQRLSPLYISVHTLAADIRLRLLGLRRNDRLLEKIRFLADHAIQMHAQIVLCPGYNDGAVLRQTLEQLALYYPAVQSVAVVPVGLTRHRKTLPRLQPVTKKIAERTLKQLEESAVLYKKSWDVWWVYAADEFYLRAGQPIPDLARYDDFPQIENGVGMCREFIQALQKTRRGFQKRVHSKKISLVTGRSAAPVLEEHLMPRLAAMAGLTPRLCVIHNDFYGRRVTVSGLLVGQDIYRQLRGQSLGDAVYLPPNCLNHDGLFLDDWTVARLEQALGVAVYQPSHIMEFLKSL